MDATSLIAAARTLIKPCHLLIPTDDIAHASAYWKGRGVTDPLSPFLEHWITIDCALIGENTERQEWLSVWVNTEDWQTGASNRVHIEKPGTFFDGVPLVARAAESLPPLDAVFRFGGEEIQRWLADNDWQPDWGYNDNFRDHDTVEKYESIYQETCPLYSSEAHAVVGGWHFPWPDDDWVDRLSEKLMIWTIADSEPWVEVWKTQGKLTVAQRHT